MSIDGPANRTLENLRNLRISGPVLCLALALGGCRHIDRSVRLDLLAVQPDRVAPTQILNGDEASRQLVYDGFRRGPDGVLVIPPREHSAAFGFYATSTGISHVEILGSCAPAAEVTVRINDALAGRTEFGPDLKVYRCQIDPKRVRPGLNTCVLRFPKKSVEDPGRRVRIETIRIGGAESSTAVMTPSTLRMKGATEVSWLITPQMDMLEFAGNFAAEDAAHASAGIYVETDRGGRVPLWESNLDLVGSPRGFGGEVLLGPFSDAPARLVVGFRGSSPSSELTLNRLRLMRDGSHARQATLPAQTISSATSPNIVIFLVDAMRRDHLSIYGYPRPVSPGLDAFARRAVVFDEAWSQSSWTSPAVASLFTGEYPATHGIQNHGQALHPDFRTLAELLRSKGYHTMAVVANAGICSAMGYDQGFDEFIHRTEKAGPLVDEAIARIEAARKSPSPFLLYVHVMDVHYPYRRAPAPFDDQVHQAADVHLTEDQISIKELKRGSQIPTAADMAYLLSVYDSEIRYVDAQFSRLLQAAEASPGRHGLLTVFMTDHGEEFNDHGGYYHGHSLYNELTRIALVIGPESMSRRVKEPVQTIDLYSTLSRLAGEAVQTPGRDIAPILAGAAPPPSFTQPIFSETDLASPYRSVVLAGTKMILLDRSGLGRGDTARLFDEARDPFERAPLRGERHDVKEDYYRRLQSRHEAESIRRRTFALKDINREMDEDTRRELQALGYIGGGEK